MSGREVFWTIWYGYEVFWTTRFSWRFHLSISLSIFLLSILWKIVHSSGIARKERHFDFNLHFLKEVYFAFFVLEGSKQFLHSLFNFSSQISYVHRLADSLHQKLKTANNLVRQARAIIERKDSANKLQIVTEPKLQDLIKNTKELKIKVNTEKFYFSFEFHSKIWE